MLLNLVYYNFCDELVVCLFSYLEFVVGYVKIILKFKIK